MWQVLFTLQQASEENYLLLPLRFAQDLVMDSLRSTGIAFYLNPSFNLEETIEDLRQSIGTDFEIVSREELHQSVYRVFQIEKIVRIFLF